MFNSKELLDLKFKSLVTSSSSPTETSVKLDIIKPDEPLSTSTKNISTIKPTITQTSVKEAQIIHSQPVDSRPLFQRLASLKEQQEEDYHANYRLANNQQKQQDNEFIYLQMDQNNRNIAEIKRNDDTLVDEFRLQVGALGVETGLKQSYMKDASSSSTSVSLNVKRKVNLASLGIILKKTKLQSASVSASAYSISPSLVEYPSSDSED